MAENIQNTLQRWLEPMGADLPALYLVGGAVRDFWLYRRPRDIDLMCTAPESLAERLGALHKAAVVPFVNNKIDAPCYRVVNLADPADFLDLVPIHGGSVKADLARRDFTINAAAIRVVPGGLLAECIDPLGGVDDLRAGLVRMVDATAFAADPLRVLRAMRFAAELNFIIVPATIEAMAAHAGQITTVAVERIIKEVFAVLAVAESARHIASLNTLGILAPILPEIGPMKGCRQNDHHHLDIWGHSLAVLENLEQILVGQAAHFGAGAAVKIQEYLSRPHRLSVLKLAALIHDVGKPGTRSIDPQSGKVNFLGHDAAGSEAAAAIAARLKLAGQDRDLLVLLVANHMHALFWSEPEVKPKTILKWCRRLGEDIVALILLSMADTLATRGPAASDAHRAPPGLGRRDRTGLLCGHLAQDRGQAPGFRQRPDRIGNGTRTEDGPCAGSPASGPRRWGNQRRERSAGNGRACREDRINARWRRVQRKVMSSKPVLGCLHLLCAMVRWRQTVVVKITNNTACRQGDLADHK